MLIKDIISILEEWYPPELANIEDANKIGLTIGSPNQNLGHILLALDLNIDVIEEAIKKQANLIIAHHPFPYYPLSSFNVEQEHTQILKLMMNHNLNFYSAHTNLDVAKMGVNDTLANCLDLKNIAGEVKRDHYLRTGEIVSTSLSEFCEVVRNKFALKSLKLIGNPSKVIKKVGIVGGSGCHLEEINQAIASKCDVYITGEFKLSMVQYAAFHQLAMIEIPHGLERLVFNQVRKQLESRLESKFKVYISKINTDPIWYF